MFRLNTVHQYKYNIIKIWSRDIKSGKIIACNCKRSLAWNILLHSLDYMEHIAVFQVRTNTWNYFLFH